MKALYSPFALIEALFGGFVRDTPVAHIRYPVRVIVHPHGDQIVEADGAVLCTFDIGNRKAFEVANKLNGDTP